MKLKVCSSLKIILGLSILSIACGCSSFSAGKLALKDVRPVETKLATNEWDAPLKVDVGSFQDRRASIDVGSLGGEALFSEADVALVVQRAVEQSFKQSGARLSKFSAPMLRGDVERWYVEAQTGFPTSELKADAELRVELIDDQGMVRYQGKYSGSNEVSHPFATQERLSNALDEAMHQAIAEILSDQKLIGVIRELNRPVQ